MYDITQYFTKNSNGEFIEGFLCDENSADVKLLFIMKEPHNTDGETTFWFRDIVNRNRYNRNGTKMYNTLSRVAKYVLDYYESDIFNKCSYINLYPYDGDARVNTKKPSGYWATRMAILNKINNTSNSTIDSNSVKVAEKRINLLSCLDECGIKYIVTVQDLFNVITTEDSRSESGLIKRDNKTAFRKGQCIFNKNLTVYEYYHPSAPCVSYKMLDEAIQKKRS